MNPIYPQLANATQAQQAIANYFSSTHNIGQLTLDAIYETCLELPEVTSYLASCPDLQAAVSFARRKISDQITSYVNRMQGRAPGPAVAQSSWISQSVYAAEYERKEAARYAERLALAAQSRGEIPATEGVDPFKQVQFDASTSSRLSKDINGRKSNYPNTQSFPTDKE